MTERERQKERRTASVLATMQAASAPLSLSAHTDAQCTDTVTQKGREDEEGGERKGETEGDRGRQRRKASERQFKTVEGSYSRYQM